MVSPAGSHWHQGCGRTEGRYLHPTASMKGIPTHRRITRTVSLAHNRERECGRLVGLYLRQRASKRVIRTRTGRARPHQLLHNRRHRPESPHLHPHIGSTVLQTSPPRIISPRDGQRHRSLREGLQLHLLLRAGRLLLRRSRIGRTRRSRTKATRRTRKRTISRITTKQKPRFRNPRAVALDAPRPPSLGPFSVLAQIVTSSQRIKATCSGSL